VKEKISETDSQSSKHRATKEKTSEQQKSKQIDVEQIRVLDSSKWFTSHKPFENNMEKNQLNEKKAYQFINIRHLIASSFRPGRLSNKDILQRLFPMHSGAVQELVLQGCNGDVVKAIEHFLSIQEYHAL